MPIELYPHQREALDRIKTGSILCGGTGSGKSITAIAYYYIQHGGDIDSKSKYSRMVNPRDLYIITTARKRDTLEWEQELSRFLLSSDPETNAYDNKVVVDSWNNIGKYVDVKGAFFIFDEQRVVGSGAWVKSFLKITKVNDWILLSATPGDTWSDYIPVFIANEFYRNKTEFIAEHIVYNRFMKYPKVDRYLNTGRLVRLRNNILVDMDFHRETVSHNEDVFVDYDPVRYKDIYRNRWNYDKSAPIETASEMCYQLRKTVNSDPSRIVRILEIFEKHPKVIIFYNFDYELEILKNTWYGDGVEVAEWNGHKHQEIPQSEKWVYLVNYTAGAEGWNCIKTDTVIFYSQNYSYKVLVQASGRIDRLNTPYTDLYYYHLRSRSPIDIAIMRALKQKKTFNESRFAKMVN